MFEMFLCRVSVLLSHDFPIHEDRKIRAPKAKQTGENVSQHPEGKLWQVKALASMVWWLF